MCGCCISVRWGRPWGGVGVGGVASGRENEFEDKAYQQFGLALETSQRCGKKGVECW